MRYIHALACYLLSALLLTACTFGAQQDVDFNDPRWADCPFRVTSTCLTDVDSAATTKAYLVGGETTMIAVAQNLSNYSQRNNVIEYTGTYLSSDLEGMPLTLSGKVVMPVNKEDVKGIIFVSHFTIGANEEAPSNSFPLEAVLAQKGFAMIFPDYMGYGITADSIHPYLVLDKGAEQSADMLMAVMYGFFPALGLETEGKPLYLMGFSQGGANTMSLLRYLEMNYPDVYVHRAFAGGGPYDVLATYDRFVESDSADYPVAVPLMLQGMIYGNRLNINISDLAQPFVAENLDEWINTKRYSTGQINDLIGTKVTHEILSEKGMDRTSPEVSELYKAMTENSILSYSWTPKSPCYIFHSMNDDVVTFRNAEKARAKWRDGNIQYNFGYYGTHLKSCLRFIFTVRTLLDEEYKNGTPKF